MSLQRKDPHSQDATGPADIDELATVKRAIRRRIVQGAFGKREYLKGIAEHGMGLEALGRAQIRRLEIGGLSQESVAKVLRSIKRVTDWPKLWEEAGDEMAAAGNHRAASFAFLYGTHWAVIRDEMRERLMNKALAEYQRVDHAAPLEPLTLPIAGRHVAAYLQVPENVEGEAPVILLYGGITAFKEEMHLQSEMLLRAGIAVCRIDLPGYGQTEGVLDLPWLDEIPRAIIDRLIADERIDENRVFSAGICAGGIFATACAYVYPISEVVLISTPYDPIHFMMHATVPMYEALENATGLTTEDVVDLFAGVEIPRRNQSLYSSLCLFYGERDEMVPPSVVQQFENTVMGPVTSYVYADQNHACIGRMDEVFETIISRIHERGQVMDVEEEDVA